MRKCCLQLFCELDQTTTVHEKNATSNFFFSDTAMILKLVMVTTLTSVGKAEWHGESS